MSTSLGQPPRLQCLDGLRGIAIFGVVLVHTAQISGELNPLLEGLALYGAKGVQLFFVVSGFTLAAAYWDRFPGFATFLIRRAARILPMFYLGIVLYSALALLPQFSFVQPQSLHTLLATITLSHGWHPSTINHVVPGGWSIAAEWTFYLCFPVLLTLMRRQRTALFFTIGIFAAATITYLALARLTGDAPFAYFFWLTQLPAFVLGILAYQLARYTNLHIVAFLFRASTAALLFAALTQTPLSNFLVADVLFAALVLSAVSVRPKFLTTPWLISLGQVSYSVYIWHFTVLALLEWLLPAAARTADLGFVLLFLTALSIAYALAKASYALIESPCIQWAKRITLRVSKTSDLPLQTS